MNETQKCRFLAQATAIVVVALGVYMAYTASIQNGPKWQATWVLVALGGVAYYIIAGYIEYPELQGEST